MNVEVKLFAYFRDNRFKVKNFTFEEAVPVSHVLEHLGINADEVGVTMINGRHCRLDTHLQPDDSLGIFPMIGGG